MTHRPPRVLILGGTGMLGSMLVKVLGSDHRLEVTATYTGQTETGPTGVVTYGPGVNWTRFIAGGVFPGRFDWIINAIGATKPRIDHGNPWSIEQAIEANSAFPFQLALFAEQTDAHVIQIATDCAYSGRQLVAATESDPTDATDIYGRTKALGEVRHPNVHLLRCSIIGPEVATPARYLLEWLRSQPRGASVPGFMNHVWNGITTYHFARICLGVITHRRALGSLTHVIPAYAVTKAELCQEIAEAFHLPISIRPVDAPHAVNMALGTEFGTDLDALWALAGYPMRPSIAAMVQELATFERALEREEPA
jgi:dTDP-4-dehydrorhamnose reductase